MTTGGVQVAEAGVRMCRAALYSAAAAFASAPASSGLVDGDHVGEFEDALLDPLQLVAGARQHQDEEEIGQVGDRRLRLPDADGLDQDHVEACGLAEQHRLAGLGRDAAQRAGGGGRADEGVRVDREPRHAGLVAENRAAGAGRSGIDRQHRHLVARASAWCPSVSMAVDLPTPGTPVMPTRTALPVRGISS